MFTPKECGAVALWSQQELDDAHVDAAAAILWVSPGQWTS